MYLVATNARWLPYLADEGIRCVHYSTHRVKRQFGLNQDVPDDLTMVLDFATLVCPFLLPHAFDYWSKLFTVVTIPNSQRVGFCIAPMHTY